VRIFYGFNFSPMIAYNFRSNRLQSSSPDTTPDSAPATSPIPTVSSLGSAARTGILWAVFHPAGAQDLTLHAYDAEDLQDNLFLRYGSSLDVGPWVANSDYGNSFQVPTVIHGRVYTGTRDHLVVFGLKHRPRCVPAVECDDAVVFHCTKDSEVDEFELQRRQDGQWKPLAASAAAGAAPEFVSLWDYVPAGGATYRVCSRPTADCTDEFASRSAHRSCGRGVKKAAESCGTEGKPPCLLQQPWPPGGRSRSEKD
jgi:hypothetical protein